MSKDEKSGPRMPTAILLHARKSRRIKIEARVVEHIVCEFEPVMRKSSAVTTLVQLCSGKNAYA